MKKEVKSKVKEIADYAGLGIEEMGKDEGLRIDAITIMKKQQGRTDPFVRVLQEFASAVVNHEFSKNTYRVMMLFFSTCQYQNFVNMDIKTISETLQITERNTIEAVKKLCENNIIIKVENLTDRRRNDYFLNPLAVWKGQTEDRRKTVKKLTDSKTQLNLFPNSVKGLLEGE
jgi:DNA-binding MarR family transcriptional regulator